MLKSKAVVLAMVAGVFTMAGLAHANARDEVKLKGVKCMLCGMQVSEKHAVDYNGGKVFFGCAGCPPRFSKDTAKYAAKANAQLVATKQAHQKLCPIMGKPVKRDLKLKVAGAEVYFCCKGCKTEVASLKGELQTEKVFGKKVFKKAFHVGKHDGHEKHNH